MSDENNEKVLDLLFDKYVYGLSAEQEAELERLGYDPKDAESIERTVATLAMADLDTEAEMPADLQAKLQLAAADFAGQMRLAEPEEEPAPDRQIVLSNGGSGSWFGWLGWAAAAAASIALAISLFVPRGVDDRAGLETPSPTPVREEQLDPAQQRQRLIDSSPEMVKAEWGKGNMPNMQVSGDVVWNDEKQAGYMRFRGLPKNDPNRETYQLWIFDETQSEKTPIDGGTFNVNSDGEVIIPIDAKLTARNPKAFAVTMEKPGGVVVSERKRVVALGAVKPDQG